jgi:hypothetical protein
MYAFPKSNPVVNLYYSGRTDRAVPTADDVAYHLPTLRFTVLKRGQEEILAVRAA